MHPLQTFPKKSKKKWKGNYSAKKSNVLPRKIVTSMFEETRDYYRKIFCECLYLDSIKRKRTNIRDLFCAMADKTGLEELQKWIILDFDIIEQTFKNRDQMEKVWALATKEEIPKTIMSKTPVERRKKEYGGHPDDGYHTDSDREPDNEVIPTNEGPEISQVILENDISNFIDCFGVAHRPMTENDVDDIANALRENKQHEELEFRHCGLNKYLLKKLQDNVERLQVKIKKLSVTAHENIDRLFPNICEFMGRCGTSELNIEECSGATMGILSHFIDKYKVNLETLDLSYRVNNDYQQLGVIIGKGISELSLVNCRLQLEDFKNMMGHASKLKYLDISYNAIDKDSMAILSGLLSKEGDVTLIMEGCDLSARELSGIENLHGTKIEKLDLSHNETLETEGLEEVGRLVRRFSLKDVRLSSCDLTEDSLSSFKNGIASYQLVSLDLSNNTGIASCHEEIAELTHMSGLVELDLSDCKMTPTQVQRLGESLRTRHTKVRSINLSDSERRTIDLKYINALKVFLESNVCSQLKLVLPHLSEKDKALLETSLLVKSK